MDPETQRVVLNELNSHELGFPVSGRNIAEKHSLEFSEIVTAAGELERKSRIGHYPITVISETDSLNNLRDVLISMERIEQLREKHELTLRIAGVQNFDADQYAAIESLHLQFESRGYAFRMPRLITASAAQSLFEVVSIYLAMKTVDKATDRALDKAFDEIIEVTSRTIKRLHQLCRSKFQHRQTTTIIVIDAETNEEIGRVEIKDEPPDDES
ncbi:hypothetical protein PDG61_08725 [Mycolicibacterium sp. BiH015]|uniref:hypothetical protein n=1 Tax=Mycolicibacterium sp. BiH015 TaxID=3018808 RepID=UPI0022E01A83|nr:hypothetical protein [Mycolicibacterium sp. BiH015]MDA2890992.1 hypothetical protein [Mycolicibacterium sp. BiH015]